MKPIVVISFPQAIRVLMVQRTIKYTTEEYNLFVSEVSKLTKNMNKAMNISISSIACAN